MRCVLLLWLVGVAACRQTPAPPSLAEARDALAPARRRAEERPWQARRAVVLLPESALPNDDVQALLNARAAALAACAPGPTGRRLDALVRLRPDGGREVVAFDDQTLARAPEAERCLEAAFAQGTLPRPRQLATLVFAPGWFE